MVDVTISLPEPVYNIYKYAAKSMNNCSVEEMVSVALQAYAQYIFEEMVENGEIKP